MRGLTYITHEGEVITVKDFDAVNKMAYVEIGSGQHKWYHEGENSTWTKLPERYIPDTPDQMEEEETSNEEETPVKKTRKKKINDTTDTQ